MAHACGSSTIESNATALAVCLREDGCMRDTGWATTASREVYGNQWIRVREDDVVRPDGGTGIYGVLEMRNPAVFIVAIDDENRVVLIDLYRYTTARWSTEVPAGSADGEDPLVAAKRELAEETGLVADEWLPVGRMTSLNGVANAPEFVFVARGLRAADDDAAATRAEEGIAAVRREPWSEALALVRDGTITDGETISALMLAGLAVGLIGG